MTNEKLEQAFNKALAQWNAANPGLEINGNEMQAVRYFFWAGSEFGCNAAVEIYRKNVSTVHLICTETLRGPG